MTHGMPLGTNGVQTALYVDDTCLFKISFPIEVANRRLAIHINRTLFLYLDANKMKLTTDKTKNMVIIKRRTESIVNKLTNKEQETETKHTQKYL